MILALFLLLLQSQPRTSVTLVIDDAHPASAKITGYRWNMDGVKNSTKVKIPPPCTDCLERTYNLAGGIHTLIVTPYTAAGDLERDAATVTLTIDTTQGSHEQVTRVTLTPVKKE
jgi:hypothetical protein